MNNKREIANDLSTLRDLIRWGTSQFNAAGLTFAQGMPTAIDEAVYLCLSALHLPPDFSVDYFDCVLTMDERLNVLNLFQQRIEQHKPAAYITNEAWFCGMSFYVDERVLIPRSPIAELIMQHFEPWISAGDEPGEVTEILDLCTGSGCIALACAEYFPQAHVDATDISRDALEVAGINRENHGLEGRVTFIESDVFEKVPDKTYDIIVSNPPYVSQAEVDALPKEFQHEPGSLALQAGFDGMDIVRRIVTEARPFLKESGILVVEVGYSRPALEKLMPDLPYLWVEFEYGGEGVFILQAKDLGDV